MLQSGLSIVVYIAWAVIGFGVFYRFIQTWRRHSLKFAIARLFTVRILVPILLVSALTLVKLSLKFVYPQQIGVVVSLLEPEQGIRPEPIDAGLHWVWPLVEKAVIYPIYWQTYTMAGRAFESEKGVADAIIARTMDSQEVIMDISVIFRLDPTQIVDLHILWQHRYKTDLLRPHVRAILRRLVSQYTVDEVNSDKRTRLEQDLDQQLKAATIEDGLIVQHALLRNIAFSKEYASSVERKQVALQGEKMKEHEAQQITNLAQGQARRIKIIANAEAEAVRVKAQARADAKLIQAEAEKKALSLVAEALQNRQNLLTYRYIERLSPNIQAVVLPNDMPLIFPLPDMQIPAEKQPH